MNRRSFITSCVTALVAIQVPANVVTALCGSRATENYCLTKLTGMWLAEQKSSRGIVNFECGKEFFKALEGELQACQRFGSPTTDKPQLAFKAGRITVVEDGWDVRVIRNG